MAAKTVAADPCPRMLVIKSLVTEHRRATCGMGRLNDLNDPPFRTAAPCLESEVCDDLGRSSVVEFWKNRFKFDWETPSETAVSARAIANGSIRLIRGAARGGR